MDHKDDAPARTGATAGRAGAGTVAGALARVCRSRRPSPMELIFLPLLFLVMWFVLIRPQQARVRAQRDLVASLQTGDRVVTAGGIVGTITVLDGGEARLEVSPGVELTVLRGAVSRKLGPPDGADTDGGDSPDGTG